MGFRDWAIEKLNRGQPLIAFDQPSEPVTNTRVNSLTAYNTVEIVNRGVNYIVDSCSEFDIDVKGKHNSTGRIQGTLRQNKIKKLLNVQANPYIDIDVFRRNMVMDLLLHGNAYIYWDGGYLYNIPAESMKIVKDTKTFVSHYEYSNTKYKVDEIIHIRENSSQSIYVGTSRLESAKDSISSLKNMQEFHDNFFKNGAIPGLVISTPNVLSDRVKKKKLLDWMQQFSTRTGGRRPVILDGDYKIDTLNTRDLRELDFRESIATLEVKVAKALGIPPILLESGNNANISPNVRLFYSSTVLPIVTKIVRAMEAFFGYDLAVVTQGVLALRPDLKEEANYFSALTNAGIMTRNEARIKLRLEESEDPVADKLTIPANIAGSAADPGTGGRPENDNP